MNNYYVLSLPGTNLLILSLTLYYILNYSILVVIFIFLDIFFFYKQKEILSNFFFINLKSLNNSVVLLSENFIQ